MKILRPAKCLTPRLSNLQISIPSKLKRKIGNLIGLPNLKTRTKEVYKLTTVNNPTIIQGLLSIEDKQDHIFMHLIESAKFNKGKSKVYLGVPGNLVAFACKVSVDKGYEGFLAFDAKTALIKHYEQSLYATHFRGLRMFIETNAALKLISQYFKR